jgi:hypothetical protein
VIRSAAKGSAGKSRPRAAGRCGGGSCRLSRRCRRSRIGYTDTWRTRRRGAGADHAVEAAAIGGIGTARILVRVIGVERVVVQDDCRKLLDRFRRIGVLAGDLEYRHAASGDFDALEAAGQAGELLGKRVVQIEVLQCQKRAVGGGKRRVFIVFHRVVPSFHYLRAALRTPTVVFSNTLTSPSSQSGTSSSFSESVP